MAITKENQILKMDSIDNGLAHFDKAISKLQNAISDLENIKRKCNSDIVDITGVVAPATKISESIKQLEDLIVDIKDAKNSIKTEAKQVIAKQKKEYKEYQEKEKEKEKEKK